VAGTLTCDVTVWITDFNLIAGTSMDVLLSAYQLVRSDPIAHRLTNRIRYWGLLAFAARYTLPSMPEKPRALLRFGRDLFHSLFIEP
jgi:hypothetical protein